MPQSDSENIVFLRMNTDHFISFSGVRPSNCVCARNLKRVSDALLRWPSPIAAAK
jgi:hypothetical protein